LERLAFSKPNIDEQSHAPESRVGRFLNGALLAATAVMRNVLTRYLRLSGGGGDVGGFDATKAQSV